MFWCRFFHRWFYVDANHRHCIRRGCALAQKKLDSRWMTIPVPNPRRTMYTF